MSRSSNLPSGCVLALVLLITTLWSGHAAWAQTQVFASESAVKAAFLAKFTGFVEWPPGTFQTTSDPIVIGIAGSEAVAADLQQIVGLHKADGRPILVRRLPGSGGWSGIHVLFAGVTRDSQLQDMLSRVPGPVLIVTEQGDGLRMGAALNMFVDAGRMRFAASTVAAEARGLRLSSRLLALAKAVDGRTQ